MSEKKSIPEYESYCIEIEKIETEKNTKIIGNMTCFFSEYEACSCILQEKSISFKFEPLTILGDLRNIKQQKSSYEESPLNSYGYEYGFKTPIYIGNDAQYFDFVSNLDKIMRNNQYITLENLKAIENQYKLKLDCKILVEENNPAFELLKKRERHAPKKIYNSLKYTFGETNKELTQETYMNKNHQFSYHCNNMAEVIFAIFHFMVMHKYEFRTCVLCQKIYVKIPNQGQGKYCSRKNPLFLDKNSADILKKEMKKEHIEKLKDLNCQAFMIKFLEIIRNKKKRKLMYTYCDEQINEFCNNFNDCRDEVKKAPTAQNLIKLYSFKWENKKE